MCVHCLRFFILSWLLFISVETAASHDSLSYDQSIAKRVQAHLILSDYDGASQEVASALSLHPDSQILLEQSIKVLAAQGNEKEMMITWKRYRDLFQDAANESKLLEPIAWGIINKASLSSTPLYRALACLAAYFVQDIKGVHILKKKLQDSNASVRAMAVELASGLKDRQLCEEMRQLLRNEKNWYVRIEVIKAIGKMKIEEAQGELERILRDNGSHFEEKMAAAESLVNLMENADPGEVERLVSSDRAGLRLLACRIVAFFGLKSCVDLLEPLLYDHMGIIRAEAVQTLGTVRAIQLKGIPIAEKIEPLLSDSNFHVAIAASWVLTLYDPVEGQNCLQKWLENENSEARRFAAAALAKTGRYGFPLMKKGFIESSDPYVKINLALGLITRRNDLTAAEADLVCGFIYQMLASSRERWMWKEEGGFRSLLPSDLKHREEIANYPQTEDQVVRLEILTILSIMKYSKAQEAVKEFLRTNSWGISGSAAALLLTEGDENSVDLVLPLLQDPDDKVKVQAALVISLWSRDETAITILEQAYATANREMKERILEGLARIGSKSSIPFLATVLDEPYQSLRIIAACALLQCINS